MKGIDGYFADPELLPMYDKVIGQERLSREDGLTLYRTPDLLGVGYLADLVRRRLHGNKAYYISNQHLNYSNICINGCIVDLIKKGATSGDPVARQGYYDEVNKLYAQHVPTIVIAHGTVNLAFQALVEGVVIGPYDENFNLMKTADGTVVFSQDGEPVSLFCGDETDGNSFRACGLIFSSLYNFSTTSIPEPDLAEECTGNADASEWTCTLRQDVVFSNGATFDANDVVATFSAGMDYNYPLRKGNTGTYRPVELALAPRRP